MTAPTWREPPDFADSTLHGPDSGAELFVVEGLLDQRLAGIEIAVNRHGFNVAAQGAAAASAQVYLDVDLGGLRIIGED